MTMQAYALRYADVDSVITLTHEACSIAGGYDGYAMLNLAYVAYQQMDYQLVDSLLNVIRTQDDEELPLLCADVMEMKTTQRTSEGVAFFQAMHMAEKHMNRLADRPMSQKEQLFYIYACSEFHIICSTYYYYQEQYPQARAEIAQVKAMGLELRDMAQWIYYNYMMGSGGLVECDDEQERVLTEFDYLMTAYTLASRLGYVYFEANALQALSPVIQKYGSLITEERSEDYLTLISRMLNLYETDIPMVMSTHAIHLFQQYMDMFQTACAYRTRGELNFAEGNYPDAIDDYACALHCVNLYHQHYYHSADTLSMYDSLSAEKSVELRWIKDSTIYTVPDWIAGIRQQISMTYSAMGNKAASDFNRNAYLDILENTNQNEEYDARKQELTSKVRALRMKVWAVLLLGGLMIVLALVYRRRVHRRTSQLHARLQRLRSGEEVPEDIALMDEKCEELREALQVTRLHLTANKTSNVERRAKVSLVHAIIPYLDRIKGEVLRMKRSGVAEPQRKAYVVELTNEIEAYNRVLTEWIKMNQGELSLHITTVSLAHLFSILREGHYAFDQKGVTLKVDDTQAQVKGDEALTLFMINTLADNARKFTPQGGRVTLSAQETDDYVEIRVSDTGEGLSPEDVDTLNHSKVYDPALIGSSSQDKKGFGFGLMNCRGIIEKYKKQSAIFNCCAFGVSSEKGRGSTFFFRLPRVLGMLLLLFSLSFSLKADPVALYDSVYTCNVEGHYNQALEYGERALKEISPRLLLSEVQPGALPFEIATYSKTDSLDYWLLMGLRNELALSALALNDWPLYEYNNRIYTQLQKFANQDDTLPEYCEQMERSQRGGHVLFFLILLFTVVTLYYIYKLLINRQLESNEDTTREIDAFLAEQHKTREEELQRLSDAVARSRYEENRLHVQNQVLDNCLSAIKHESMYYPSRIRQLAERMGDTDIEQMDELVNYYRQVYSILCSQADEQLEQPGFRRQTLAADDMADAFGRSVSSVQRRCGKPLDAKAQASGPFVLGDIVLLETLLDQLIDYMSRRATRLLFACREQDRFVDFSLQDPDHLLSEEEMHNLFYPSEESIPLLVAKQIVREHDTYSGNPGLRLYATAEAEGYAIHFTLQRQ